MSVEPGFEIPSWEMPSVSRERMRTMAAILRDPNPVHWDHELCNSLPLGIGKRTINQGPLGLSYMINMLHAWAGPESVRRVFMTFPKIVLSEDAVTAKGVVTAVLDNHVVECDIWLERAGERLLEGKATVQLDN
ncbi:MAG: MaoC family dehydratase [Pseudomonadales bacterium]|nr:MaoC family dehydratase [Pseudomonadales bacterium]MBO6563520.1 MaoC family dehydratase [Pseudomonadales bacterium]MBO6596834.1 MaoC family dehydratase [Pseudomonadales bacterium]MBO6659008.1 MaoC family dehydratase [Pseudomonadales bacterium]MBO6703505.1 MaoC family dehydratase [Pseudomonadales bacterium]